MGEAGTKRGWPFILIWTGLWLLIAAAVLLFLTRTPPGPPYCIDYCGPGFEFLFLVLLVLVALWLVGLVWGLRRRRRDV